MSEAMDNSTEQIIKIPLSIQGKYAGMYEAIIDLQDADLANERWSACVHEKGKRVYAQQTTPSRQLQRVIMVRMIGRELKKGEYVDHINNNPLDNRRSNLRIVTNRQNAWNSRSWLGEIKYRGVSFHRKTNSFRARIHIDGQEMHLGLYDTAEEAYEVYCQVAKEHFGDLAKLEYSEASTDNRLNRHEIIATTQLSFFDGIQIRLSKNGKYNEYKAIIDIVDGDLAQSNWCVTGVKKSNKPKYAIRKAEPKNELMHRVIMERILGRSLQDGECVDHINGDGLDNRRENLRLASILQNNWNMRKSTRNTSGYKGVSYDKTRNKYRATIAVNGKTKDLGRFDTAEAAFDAYKKATIEYRGEFANFGDKD